jgi:hypothetical protein
METTMHSGNFFGDGTGFLAKPWFPHRFEMEMAALANPDVGLVDCPFFVDATRIRRPRFKALRMNLRSLTLPRQYYTVESVLPANWPYGEPVAFLEAPRVDDTYRLGNGALVPHMYRGSGGGAGGICSYCEWDTVKGTTGINAHVVAVRAWITCFEEWLSCNGQFSLTDWDSMAEELLANWPQLIEAMRDAI